MLPIIGDFISVSPTRKEVFLELNILNLMINYKKNVINNILFI